MFGKVIYLFVLVFLICRMGSLTLIYIELDRVKLVGLSAVSTSLYRVVQG